VVCSLRACSRLMAMAGLRYVDENILAEIARRDERPGRAAAWLPIRAGAKEFPTGNVRAIFITYRPMNRTRFVAVILFLPGLLFAGNQQIGTQDSAKSFPGPDFVLGDKDSKPAKSGLVLGPMKSDGKGGTKGTFAVRGRASLGYVGSLAFSGDGKVLAVASTPSRVDVWDVDSQKKVQTLQGSNTIALSSDGRLLAEDGNGIELWDVASGKLEKRIPRELKTFEPGSQNTIPSVVFDPAGTLLDVTANGEADSVYDVTTGRLLATLKHAQGSQFSRDGALLIGGNAKYLAVWSTKDWTKVREVPNGPDYITQIAASPEKDLVVIGGPDGARLLRLSSGEEIASVGSRDTRTSRRSIRAAHSYSLIPRAGSRFGTLPGSFIVRGQTSVTASWP
jgi:WD40 repeat protein